MTVYSVNIAPFFQAIISVLVAIVGVLGNVVLYRLSQKFHLDISAGRQAAFDSALNKSLTYGATQATNEIAAKGWDHVTVKNEVVATALKQAVSTFPDALAGVGLSADLNDPKNTATLTAALQRALPSAMTEVSASPATPATPAAAAVTTGEEGQTVATIHVALPAAPKA